MSKPIGYVVMFCRRGHPSEPMGQNASWNSNGLGLLRHTWYSMFLTEDEAVAAVREMGAEAKQRKAPWINGASCRIVAVFDHKSGPDEALMNASHERRFKGATT